MNKQDAVERMFVPGKRRYRMNLLMEKLPETTLAAIALFILVMNLDKILRCILLMLILFTLKTPTYLKNIKYGFYYNVT